MGVTDIPFLEVVSLRVAIVEVAIALLLCVNDNASLLSLGWSGQPESLI